MAVLSSTVPLVWVAQASRAAHARWSMVDVDERSALCLLPLHHHHQHHSLSLLLLSAPLTLSHSLTLLLLLLRLCSFCVPSRGSPCIARRRSRHEQALGQPVPPTRQEARQRAAVALDRWFERRGTGGWCC